MNLETIKYELSLGQVPPPTLAEYSDCLAALAAQNYDKLLELQMDFTNFFNAERGNYKSDKAVKMAWQNTEQGKAELKLETQQKQIKVLSQTIGRHLRVADNMARNLY